MYIVKNALRSISRSKGRNILIGIIVFIIAVSSCVGLSIRQAAENTKESTLANLNVTAQISVDRSSMIKGMQENSGENFDPSQFKEKMSSVQSLTLKKWKSTQMHRA